MERFEELGDQIMHRSGGGMMDEQPVRGHARRPRQAQAGRRAARAGVRRRLEHDRAHNREGTEHVADAAGRRGRALRRRRDRAARRARGCASPRSTCWTRRHGPRSDPPALPAGRPARRTAERERASSRAAARAAERRAGRASRPPPLGPSPPSAPASASSRRAARRRSRGRGGRCAVAARDVSASGVRGDEALADATGRPGSRPTPTPSRRRGRRSPSTSGASTGSTTASSSSAVRGGPLAVSDVPLAVALRTAPTAAIHNYIAGTALLYTLNGLGPGRLDQRRQAVEGAPPAAAPRGARARALHVPLPQRTSTWWSTLLPPSRRRAGPRTADDDHGRGHAELQAHLLPARRPQAAAGDPARGARSRRQDAAAGDDRRLETRRIDALTLPQPVPGLLPARPEPAALPGAGPRRRRRAERAARS